MQSANPNTKLTRQVDDRTLKGIIRTQHDRGSSDPAFERLLRQAVFASSSAKCLTLPGADYGVNMTGEEADQSWAKNGEAAAALSAHPVLLPR
jgi:hypothetical protein